MATSETSPLLRETSYAPDEEYEDATVPRSTFARNLGALDGFALLISIVIGSGVFSSPGPIDANVPSPGAGLLIWLVGGILAWTGALTMAELGTAYVTSMYELQVRRILTSYTHVKDFLVKAVSSRIFRTSMATCLDTWQRGHGCSRLCQLRWQYSVLCLWSRYIPAWASTNLTRR